MNTLKLNSIPDSMFEVENFDTKIVVNGEKGSTTLNRDAIVKSGRVVVCEYIGNMLNKRNNSNEYVSRLGNKIGYNAFEKSFSDAKFLFCAAQANAVKGMTAPTSAEMAKKDISYATDKTFLATMAAIDREVLAPIFFDVIDSVGAAGLMRWESTPFGGTREITVDSNDVFLFEDSSFGSTKSTSKNYLYAKTVTITPKVTACNATIKWYQDVVNGDAGRYYAAIIRGMWSKIYAKMISQLNKAVAGNTYIPSGLTASSYSSDNWLEITTKVAALNGVTRNDLVAVGSAQALAKVIPTDGTGGAILGLQYGLGEEWFKQGYLPNAAGVTLMEVTPAIVPGTQNSTLSTIGLGDNIYIMAKAMRGYAPLYGVYYEGTPFTLTATPSETADLTIDINVTAFFDIQPVFASKVGIITDVA